MNTTETIEKYKFYNNISGYDETLHFNSIDELKEHCIKAVQMWIFDDRMSSLDKNDLPAIVGTIGNLTRYKEFMVELNEARNNDSRIVNAILSMYKWLDDGYTYEFYKITEHRLTEHLV